MMYSDDLAYVHHAGFGGYAARAAPEIARLLARHGIRRGRVVEFGCGGGTLAEHLVNCGYEVLGIDQSPAMIRIARATAPGATFKVGALASAGIPRCAAIVAIGEVVSYVTEADGTTDLRAFFRRAAAALEPGGLLIFDFMESSEGRTFEAKSRAGDDWAMVVRATSKGRLLTRDMVIFRKVGREYRRTREIHHVRLFRREQVGAALRRAGFHIVSMRRSIGRVRMIRSDVAVIAQVPA